MNSEIIDWKVISH